MARLEAPEVYSAYHEHLLRIYAGTLDAVGDIPAERCVQQFDGGLTMGSTLEYAVFLHRRKRDL